MTKRFVAILAMKPIKFAAVHTPDWGIGMRQLLSFDEAIRLKPNLVDTYIDRGHAYRGLGDYNKAMTDYNEAIRRDPLAARAYDARATMWCLRQEFDKCSADFAEAISVDPDQPLYYRNRAHAYDAIGDRTAASTIVNSRRQASRAAPRKPRSKRRADIGTGSGE